MDDETVGSIGRGLLVFLGVGQADDDAAADGLARTVAELRIFADEEGRTNRSMLDIGGEALVVSQFTLYADTRRGRRPGFTDAAPPGLAERLYLRFAAALEELGVTGRNRLVRGRDGGRAGERRPVHDLAGYCRALNRGSAVRTSPGAILLGVGLGVFSFLSGTC